MAEIKSKYDETGWTSDKGAMRAKEVLYTAPTGRTAYGYRIEFRLGKGSIWLWENDVGLLKGEDIAQIFEAVVAQIAKGAARSGAPVYDPTKNLI